MPLFRSLYLKLLIIFGSTFFLLVLALGISYRVFQPEDLPERFRASMTSYGEYIARDIGSPPDLNRAAEIQRKNSLYLAISGPNLSWSSHAGFPEQDNHVEMRGRVLPPIFGRHPVITVSHGDYTFLISSPGWMTSESSRAALSLAAFLMAVILFGSYWLTRRVFKPIKWMKEGAEAFGAHQWQKRIPVTTRDELGDLAETMNSMAERISSHLRSINEFVIAISHEFRSPLTRMKVALEFIDDRKLRASLDGDIQVLDKMTDTLLERERLSNRGDVLRRERTDLGQLLAILYTPYANQKPGVVLRVPEAPVFAEVDLPRFSIAIRNLLENALKHGGSADRSVELRVSAQGEIKEHGAGVVIEVQDFGPGIPQDSLNRLGEPFYRADLSRSKDRPVSGFGLGLSLAYSIIHAHGGRIEVQSIEGEGSCFRIKL